MEAMARAEERFLKSANTFFQPLFRVSVLDNLGRDDPFAEPGDGECFLRALNTRVQQQQQQIAVTRRVSARSFCIVYCDCCETVDLLR